MSECLRFSVIMIAIILMSAGPALGDTGVSDSRVSLPEGPGSLEGVGDNVEMDPNMGNMRYSVPIKIPPGFGSVTPGVSLNYNSGNGTSIVGMGWSFTQPTIERSTSRRLPVYNEDDFFVADGGNELLYVAGDQVAELPCANGANGRVYRDRIETSCTRYVWCNTNGKDYWVAETGDGTRAYYGANREGGHVPAARVGKNAGEIFRYHLVDTVDVQGHHMRHSYVKDKSAFDEYAYVNKIEYNFPSSNAEELEGATARYMITFSYEARADRMSDCKGGFEEIMSKRMSGVDVWVDSTKIRYYRMTYEDDSVAALSGGFTRLKKVEHFGRDGTRYPAVFSFKYNAALHDATTTATMHGPIDLETVFPSISGFYTGKMTLIDMNGDSLPDILDTRGGNHKVLFNILAGEHSLTQHFQQSSGYIETGKTDYKLGSIAGTKVLDVNGDGFSDLGYFKSGTQINFLSNRGEGEWDGAEQSLVSTGGDVPKLFIEDGSCDFVDVDNNRRIDCIYSSNNELKIFYNRSTGWEEVGGKVIAEDGSAEAWDCPDWGTDSQFFDLTDMNGDGLLDVTVWDQNLKTVKYKINLGNGNFKKGCDESVQFDSPQEGVHDTVGKLIDHWGDSLSTALKQNRLMLQDLNNDALNDIVYIRKSDGYDEPSEIHYWLNRNGETFLKPIVIDSTKIAGLPSAKIEDGTAESDRVVFADMNGNGSTDIVWFGHDNVLKYLDLFPDRPHLISHIENGLGQISRITFESSANFQARDRSKGINWHHPLPSPMQVVSKIEVWERLTPSYVDVTEYRYHHGYYDGDEKQFRGYSEVEVISEGDPYEAAGRVVNIYDVGAPSLPGVVPGGRVNRAHWNGKLLEQHVYGGVDLDGDGTISASEEDLPVSVSVTGFTECSVQIKASDGVKGCSPVGRIGDLSVSNTDLDDDSLPEIILSVLPVSTRTTVKEGLLQADWAVIRSQSTYDGFGNLVYSEEFGAGSDDDGDETFTLSTYIPVSNDKTAGRWIAGMVSETYSSGEPVAVTSVNQLPVLGTLPSLYSHTRTYYDGEELGSLRLGLPTRNTTLMDRRVSNSGQIEEDERWLVNNEMVYDKHGNIVLTKDAHGARRAYQYDLDSLRVTGAFMELSSDSYLCRNVEFNQQWSKPQKGSAWILAEGEVTDTNAADLDCLQPTSTPVSEYAYDEFGRVIALARPGDSLSAPSEEYEYKLGLNAQGESDPSTALRSETISRIRTTSGGPLDLETIQCADGRGRTYQTLRKIKDSGGADVNYQASGFVLFNKKGKAARTYEPYFRELSERCDATEPLATHANSVTRYDGAGRVIKVTNPDETFVHTLYRPLGRRAWDENGKMTEQWSDGAGRVIAMRRPLLSGHSSQTRYMELHYDLLSRLVGYTDSAGNQKTQEFDLLGRALVVNDPNAGRLWFQYDDLGNTTRRGDERGEIIATSYDIINRKVQEWDVADEEGTRRSWYYDVAQSGCVVLGLDHCTYPVGKTVKTSYVAKGCPDDGVCSEWFGYSDRGMAIYHGATLPDSQGYRFETASNYDNANRLISTDYPDGRTISFTYDGAGRFRAMHHEGNELVEIDYNQQGLTKERRYGNGVVESYTYDARLREKTHKTVGILGNLQFYKYTRDNVGNILSIEDKSEFNGFWNGEFEYDDWYRLTKATVGTEHEEIPYEYNDIDNILKRGDKTYGYTSNKPNAVSRVGTLNYVYDDAGYVTRRGDMELLWDAWGRLVGAMEDDVSTGEFTYGVGPARVLKVETELSGWSHTLSPSFEVRNGVAIIYPRLGRSRMARLENPDFAKEVLNDTSGDGKIRVNDAWLLRKESLIE